MQVFATFDHSSYLELAISKLEEKGFNEIFAVPLDKRTEDPKLFDTLHRSDGESLINKGMFLAVIFSVIGASRGFVLEWGPIFWGLIGAAFGFILGFIFDFCVIKLKNPKMKLFKGKGTGEVILIINCREEDGKEVEDILWDYLTLGVAKVKQDKKS
ncbi:hypothetical protein SAMN05421676_10577 [Salinibacillus kushneri]|uniref:Uncharacterized protein n=1 Tax=Salinibacillus kushneri TaxID=237682 RepID=A0A1I0ETU7_9BACI|nr:hypothetical protein [Salinibacillus kushneri]SET48865.1 hypothetical protein SAMN05421676_10577 [Salinibacillus kushneri]